MQGIVQEQVEQKKKRLGKPSLLSVEDQVSNELRVLAGVPDVFPHWSVLGGA